MQQMSKKTASIRRRGIREKMLSYKKNKVLLLMLVPAVIYYALFKYRPMYGLIIAFKDYKLLDGVMKSPWAGLKYFKMAFSSTEFIRAFKNTMILSLYNIIFQFPAPIILALLFNEVRNIAFKRSIQTITYLPHFLSWVVLAGIVIDFLSPSIGPVNMLIKALGHDPIYFVGDKKYFRGVLVLSGIWKEIGWGTIIYLAALTNVDVQLYEAATIDGAGKFRQTISITLPSIANVTVIMLIFAVGRIVNDDFDQIYNLYNPNVYSVGDVISTHVYSMGLAKGMYSYATAIGLFKNVIAFVLIITTNFFARRIGDYGLW